MNRAERRRLRKPLAALADVELERKRLEAQLLEQAKSIRARSPFPGETVADALRAVERTIADLSGPQHRLVAGPALEELRGLRDDLAARARLH